jgi:hypothetical protein
MLFHQAVTGSTWHLKNVSFLEEKSFCFMFVLVRGVHDNNNMMNYGLGRSLLNASSTNAKV